MEVERRLPSGPHKIVAVLGPTNTGKTHLAMERMLGSASGMIGFPLRLLARENYERAVRIKGREAVALITGEEKIAPASARYFLCTVESMPLSRRVSFLAVDEIQMCADPDRGYIFTERLLNARGDDETMFLGAETIRPLIRRLVPDAQIVSRPRFSTLSYAGQRKISRLPPRSAIVAFNVTDVYAIAELIRRERGGAAVVLGALSPRTRNSQVALYQDGEVDYLVATDAIGMGLNMNIDHIAFASRRKFDGHVRRDLCPMELAQIAGRAGRHTRNGTFGTTTDIAPLDTEVVERIETHQFNPLKSVFWRNSDLEFDSVAKLRASLARLPDAPGLARTREADDEQALSHLTRDPDIAQRAHGREAISLLWDVCQIPDFGKVLTDGHARFLGTVYRYLSNIDRGHGGRLPANWVSQQIDRLNRTDGDIEAVMQRIANIRIWTYIAHRPGWLEDRTGWQDRMREIEDKLSDTLHERLVQRFVDRRTATLYGRIRDRQNLVACVSAEGEVLVEGHFVGVLDGLRYAPETACGVGASTGAAEKLINAAAARALYPEIRRRLRQIETAPDDVFDIDQSGQILWKGAAIARLAPGPAILSPKVALLPAELLDIPDKIRVRRHLSAWLTSRLHRDLKPLFAFSRLSVSNTARGLLYQVAENLGSMSRRSAKAQTAGLSARDRQVLRGYGLRFGRTSVYFPSLLKPKHICLRALLWAVHNKSRPLLPKQNTMSVLIGRGDVQPHFCEATGYIRLGPRAVRIDLVERLAHSVERVMRHNSAFQPSDLSSLIGCTAGEVPSILEALGYDSKVGENGWHIQARKSAHNRSPRKDRRGVSPSRPSDPSSPFARLRELQTLP